MFHQGAGVSYLILDKLDSIVEELKLLADNQIQLEIENKLQNLKKISASKNKNNLRNIYHFCRIELEKYV